MIATRSPALSPSFASAVHQKRGVAPGPLAIKPKMLGAEGQSNPA
jgi:hypothetical protein